MARAMPLKGYYYLQFPREGDTPCHARPQWKHQVLVRRQTQVQGEGLGWSLYQGFHWEGRADKNKQFRIDQFEQYMMAWAIRVVSSCQLPGPGMIQGRENTCLVCENQIKGVVNLYERDMLLTKWFTMFRNWLALGGQSLPSQIFMSKRHKIQKS